MISLCEACFNANCDHCNYVNCNCNCDEREIIFLFDEEKLS